MRYVLIPGMTDAHSDIDKLVQLCKGRKNLQVGTGLPHSRVSLHDGARECHKHIQPQWKLGKAEATHCEQMVGTAVPWKN